MFRGRIVDKIDERQGGYTDKGYSLALFDDGRVFFRIGNYGGTSTTILSPGQWYLIAGTYDYDTKEVKIYVNGILEGSEYSMQCITTIIL